MEPVSIIGIVGTALSVTKMVTEAIFKLSQLKSRYRNVPLQLTTLTGQLFIVQLALDKLSQWSSEDLLKSPRYQELALQIDTSLDCFCPLILALQNHLSELDLPQDLDMTARSKVSFLWNEKDLMDYVGLLDRQINALNLLLQAIQCKSLTEQQEFVNDEDSRTILQKAKDCNTSIIGTSDGSSIFSEGTNNHTISLEFDFDAMLLGSRAYRVAHRSNLKRVMTVSGMQQSSPSSGSRQQPPMKPLENVLEESPLSFQPSVDENHEITTQDGNPRVKGHQGRAQSSLVEVVKNPRPSHDSVIPRQGRLGLEKQNVQGLTGDQSGASTRLSGPNSEASRTVIQSRERPNVLTKSLPLSERTMPEVVSRLPKSVLVASSNNIIAPKSTLLHSLRKSWRARVTKQTTLNATKEQAGAELLEERLELKVLLLGSSESGKSTLLKGMGLQLHGEYTCDQSLSFLEIIWNNAIQGFRVILEARESLEVPLEDVNMKYHEQTIFMQPAQVGSDQFPPEARLAIDKLWMDKGILEAHRRRSEYQMYESTAYFARHIERIAAPGYVPSREDILRSRVKSTGITETTSRSNDSELLFRIFDVGGVRSERKKWIHVFENVDSVVFTVDASAYCRRLFEDETVSRMEEQLTLWDSIRNSRWFVKTSFILMFTKIDLLPEELYLHPVTNYFPDFPDPETDSLTDLISSYLVYLEFRFISLIKSAESRQRTTVMYADLVHIDEHNPASTVFRILKEQHDESELVERMNV